MKGLDAGKKKRREERKAEKLKMLEIRGVE